MDLPTSVLNLLEQKGFKRVDNHWEQTYFPGSDGETRVSKLKLLFTDNVWTIHLTDSPMECVIRFKNMTPFRYLDYLLKYNLHQL